MRYRSRTGQDELEAESLDNSSENSDGVESEGMSEGGGPDGEDSERRNQWIDRIARGKARHRENNGKAAADGKGKGPLRDRKRATGRRAGKDKDNSDSEEELAFDGMEEEIPRQNLLNSALRTTYTARPTLVIDHSIAGEKIVHAGSSSSLYKFSSLPRKTTEDINHIPGESSRGIYVNGKASEEESKPAFAAPSAIVEAARAAMSGKRSRSKGPVIDQETKEAFNKTSSNGASVGRDGLDLLRDSPPGQSSGRPPQGLKLRGNFQSPAYSGPETGSKLQSFSRGATESHFESRTLEREKSIGTWESSGQVVVKDSDRTKDKPRSNKRWKWDNDNNKGGTDYSPSERTGSVSSTIPQNVSFKDLGGIEDTIEIIRNVIEYPLAHPELYEWLGVQPPRGVLLHGPPGCGKTMLANAIAVEARVPFLKISAPEVVSGMSGESEAKVRALFAEAAKVAPCIIFIDEIDAITPKRETAQREMERRIVAQLLTCMDDLGQSLHDKDEGSAASAKRRFKHVVVIGATNRPDALDPALRRAGRFDREIALGIPDEVARARILSVLSKKLRLEGSFDFKLIARRTPGFVGADLQALIKEAAAVAVTRIFKSRDPRIAAAPSPVVRNGSANGGFHDANKVSTIAEDCKSMDAADTPHDDPSTLAVVRGTGSVESASVCGDMDTDDGEAESWRRPWTRGEMDSLSITMQDFEEAVSKVQPSAKREGFATIPDVSWDDVGSLGTVREELEFSISRPIKYPEEYQAMGLDMATGVLLYGPPGCGKTLVAKAIANEAGANFISVKGPELLNKYVGESERAVRQLFTRARASAPCVLFFDEMDAMAPKRGSDGNAAAERVVNQLLTEMDGLESRKSIFVIAATNRQVYALCRQPDMIDPALMRPGRLDKLLYVPLPDSKGRGSIMKTLVRKVPLAPDVDVCAIGESERCEGFSGADLASLVREACISSLREKELGRLEVAAGNITEAAARATEDSGPLVTNEHFNSAFIRVFPSVSNKDRLRYDDLCKKLRRARAHISKSEPEPEAVNTNATKAA
ncbi:hypothetical protein AXG93_312s1050 [Marchantia polymorpha subsp. ruderalis]|uniref:AAA+ ATPase domain-containing protein n=1 Tax=Marchantia polymorpha subsp. ruderalis TaxID=1480154 RepID=A0A176W931_MARPO|nr:hypothetical protein AXG93_312s1050 [Marchantia polymorpha subsp. ruderalis]